MRACGLQETTLSADLPLGISVVDRLSGSTVDSYRTASVALGPDSSRQPVEVTDESSRSITGLQQQVYIVSVRPMFIRNPS